MFDWVLNTSLRFSKIIDQKIFEIKEFFTVIGKVELVAPYSSKSAPLTQFLEIFISRKMIYNIEKCFITRTILINISFFRYLSLTL